MRVHEFEFMIKIKWRIDLYTLQNEIKKVNLSFPISVERCEAKKFRLCAFCVFGFIVKMRGNWVEEFNYTMKKLQLIRQIIEFSMKFFYSVSSCRVAACAASNVFHQTTIELMTVRSHIIIVACPATAHATPLSQDEGRVVDSFDRQQCLSQWKLVFSDEFIYISLTWLLSFPSHFGLLIQ